MPRYVLRTVFVGSLDILNGRLKHEERGKLPIF